MHTHSLNFATSRSDATEEFVRFSQKIEVKTRFLISSTVTVHKKQILVANAAKFIFSSTGHRGDLIPKVSGTSRVRTVENFVFSILNSKRLSA